MITAILIAFIVLLFVAGLCVVLAVSNPEFPFRDEE